MAKRKRKRTTARHRTVTKRRKKTSHRHKRRAARLRRKHRVTKRNAAGQSSKRARANTPEVEAYRAAKAAYHRAGEALRRSRSG